MREVFVSSGLMTTVRRLVVPYFVVSMTIMTLKRQVHNFTDEIMTLKNLEASCGESLIEMIPAQDRTLEESRIWIASSASQGPSQGLSSDELSMMIKVVPIIESEKSSRLINRIYLLHHGKHFKCLI